MADEATIVFPGGRYQVHGKLGAGAFGEVYKARDTLLNRTVAIKRIRLDAFADADQLVEAKERFKREAQVAAQLKHPSIVTIYDIVATDELSYIVMEFIDGTTLQSVIATRKRLSLRETVDLLSQVADALDHAHEAKVVHRDVKPANIMIEPGGRAKVTDFGIAKAESAANLTATGSIMGTPNYMSPEQARGERVDGRSDLFSLGCIVYECLAGQKPFHGESLTAVLMKILSEEPSPLDCASAGVPEEVGAILRRALAKSPAGRFSSGRELMELLRKESDRVPAPLDATLGAQTLVSPAPVPPTRREPVGDKTAPPPQPPPVNAPPPGPKSVTVRKPPQPIVFQSRPAATEPSAHRRWGWGPSEQKSGNKGLAIMLVGGLVLTASAVGLYFLKRPSTPAPVVDQNPVARVTTSIAAPAPEVETREDATPTPTTVAPAPTTVAASTVGPSPPRDARTPPGVTSAPAVSTPPPKPTPSEEPPVASPDEPPPEPTEGELPRYSRNDRIGDKRSVYGNRNFGSRADSPTVRANEAAAVNRLRFLAGIQTRYRSKRGQYGTPDQLLAAAAPNAPPGVDVDFIKRQVQRGYRFQMRVDGNSYSATATPTEYGVSGVRSFYVDGTGRIRGENKYGEPADATAPELSAR